MVELRPAVDDEVAVAPVAVEVVVVVETVALPVLVTLNAFPSPQISLESPEQAMLQLTGADQGASFEQKH